MGGEIKDIRNINLKDIYKGKYNELNLWGESYNIENILKNTNQLTGLVNFLKLHDTGGDEVLSKQEQIKACKKDLKTLKLYTILHTKSQDEKKELAKTTTSPELLAVLIKKAYIGENNESVKIEVAKNRYTSYETLRELANDYYLTVDLKNAILGNHNTDQKLRAQLESRPRS